MAFEYTSCNIILLFLLLINIIIKTINFIEGFIYIFDDVLFCFESVIYIGINVVLDLVCNPFKVGTLLSSILVL